MISLLVMVIKKKLTLEKAVCGLVMLLVLSFFLIEMLMKPLSGEDIVQQHCMAFSGGWSASLGCAKSTMDNIPRIGQIAHYLVIWKFQVLPHLGFETIVRIIDGLMAFGIVYIIAMMARGGKRLALTYSNAIAIGATFVLLVLSATFSGIFFNGFSNVHNYVPAVFFTLLFIYLWFWRDHLAKKIKYGWLQTLLLISGFLFAVSTELNSLVFFVLIVCVWIVEFCRSKNWRVAFAKWRDYVGGILGVILGFIFMYIIGNGFGATVGRSDSGYLGAISISELLSDPVRAIPVLFGNAVNNFYNYLPYLLLAATGIFILCKKQKIKQKNKSRIQLLKTAFVGILCYGIAYIAFCSPTDGVMWRLTAVVFCSLLVPIVYLVVYMIENLTWARIKTIGAWSFMILIMLMNIDNFLFMLNIETETGKMINSALEEGCLSKERIENTVLPTKSNIFRFSHGETALAYTETDWYGNIYLVNGNVLEIKDTCSEDED